MEDIKYSTELKELVVSPKQGGAYSLHDQETNRSFFGIHIGDRDGWSFFAGLGESGAELYKTKGIVRFNASDKKVILANHSGIPLTGEEKILAEEILSKLK